jgi:hypothetical protein
MSGKHILTDSAMNDDHPKRSARVAPEVDLKASVNSAQTFENES